MQINSNIILQRLRQDYPVEMYGKENSKMLFSSAEIYINNTLRFLSNHVYLASVDHLPLRPIIEKNVILVCIGDGNRLAYYKEHATLLQIRQKVDIFEVLRALQNIFHSFHQWESNLLNLFVNNPTIGDVLEQTAPIFQRSLFVLNSSFQYSAASHYHYIDKNWMAESPELDPEAFLSFLKEQEISMDKKGAFLLEFEQMSVLCCNLFNTNAEYIGCIAMDLVDHPFVEGEDQLLDYLATILEKVCETNPMLLNKEQNSLKQVLQTLIAEVPLHKKQRMLLKTINKQQDYTCVSIHYMKQIAIFPSIYVCAVFETLFANSVFFEHNGSLMGLIPTDTAATQEDESKFIMDTMAVYAREMQLCIGISNPFNDLYMLRAFYLQAEAAIENGTIRCPGQSFYRFSDFVLMELVANSTGNLPIEAYYPKGLRQILLHDQTSDISYLQTLMVFLEENMSYAQTARRLYIHRSTLLERISRIQSDLCVNLDDPDQRLYLQIVLKSLELEKLLKEQ